MTTVQIARNMTVKIEGTYRSPDDGAFEMEDDAAARALSETGVIKILDTDELAIDHPELDEANEVAAVSDDTAKYQPEEVGFLGTAYGAILNSLTVAGFKSIESVHNATEDELIALPRIGIAIARKLKEEAAEYYE